MSRQAAVRCAQLCEAYDGRIEYAYGCSLIRYNIHDVTVISDHDVIATEYTEQVTFTVRGPTTTSPAGALAAASAAATSVCTVGANKVLSTGNRIRDWKGGAALLSMTTESEPDAASTGCGFKPAARSA